MPRRGKTKEVEEKPQVETTDEKKEEKPKKGSGKKKVVKKSALADKVKSFVASVNPEYPEKVQEVMEKLVKDKEGEKTNVVFVRFSENGDDEEVNDEANIEVIKDLLFAYHTVPDKSTSGKQLMLEVLTPEDGDPHTVCFHEV